MPFIVKFLIISGIVGWLLMALIIVLGAWAVHDQRRIEKHKD